MPIGMPFEALDGGWRSEVGLAVWTPIIRLIWLARRRLTPAFNEIFLP